MFYEFMPALRPPWPPSGSADQAAHLQHLNIGVYIGVEWVGWS